MTTKLQEEELLLLNDSAKDIFHVCDRIVKSQMFDEDRRLSVMLSVLSAVIGKLNELVGDNVVIDTVIQQLEFLKSVGSRYDS